MHRIVRILSVLPAIFLILAVYLIYRQLEHVNLGDIKAAFFQLQADQILQALGLVIASFACFGFYDVTGLKECGIKHLKHGHIFRTAFAGFSISNVVGHSLISGASIRVKSYKNREISFPVISRVVLLNLVGYWTTFLLLTGLTLVWQPKDSPILSIIPFLGPTAGYALISFVAVYFVACATQGHRNFVIFGRMRLSVPRLKYAVAYFIFASLEIVGSASILYVVLPKSTPLPFFEFISLFLVAQWIGVMSQVPGGLGVLEGVLLKLLAPYASLHELFASIVFYRIFYFLLPLVTTLAYVSTRGLWPRKVRLK